MLCSPKLIYAAAMKARTVNESKIKLYYTAHTFNINTQTLKQYATTSTYKYCTTCILKTYDERILV